MLQKHTEDSVENAKPKIKKYNKKWRENHVGMFHIFHPPWISYLTYLIYTFILLLCCLKQCFLLMWQIKFTFLPMTRGNVYNLTSPRPSCRLSPQGKHYLLFPACTMLLSISVPFSVLFAPPEFQNTGQPLLCGRNFVYFQYASMTTPWWKNAGWCQFLPHLQRDRLR